MEQGLKMGSENVINSLTYYQFCRQKRVDHIQHILRSVTRDFVLIKGSVYMKSTVRDLVA